MSDVLAACYPPAWLSSAPSLPLDRPFTREAARDHGLTDRQLTRLLRGGQLVQALWGVYHVGQLEDCLDLRLACLRLVVPRDAVVTDRTAAWLLGAPMALAPGDHLMVPRVSMFRPPGYRLRNKLAASGERTFRDEDLMELGGLLVTRPLRTACDVGRLLHRDQAFAAMDSISRLGTFSVGQLVRGVERFKGHRGVVQLRGLAPWVDPRSESPGESILRLRWLDVPTLPRPELQVLVAGPDGPCFLDLGLPDLGYGAEYDGAQWHGPERMAHDRRRRDWISRNHGYTIDVFDASGIHGPTQDAGARLAAGIRRAREARRG